ncbi:MAG: hypothetical protein ABIG28_03125 [archaeon]
MTQNTQTVSEVLAAFTEKERTAATELSNYVAENFAYVPWTAQQKTDKFRKESLRNIRETTKINYLVPCVATGSLIAEKLAEDGKESTLVAFTEKGAVDKWKDGKKGRVHLDVAVFWTPDPQRSRQIFLDVGVADIQIGYEDPKSVSRGENTLRFRTSRTDERYWDRTLIASIPGKVLVRRAEEPILQTMLDYHSAQNNVLPFGLKIENVLTARDIIERDRFNIGPDNLQDYEGARGWNIKWVEGEGREIFPGIKRFNYSFQPVD